MPKTPKKGFKVCVCGVSGGIGQPLCMLMALDPRVWELSVYDLTIAMVPPEGIGVDLGHIERKCKVTPYSLETTQKPVENLEKCLTGCSLVLVPAGVPSKGRTRSELLRTNANIVKSMLEAIAKFCPEAIVGLIVNPLNSVVPAMATLYTKAGLDPLKICGITSLDGVRANKFVHEETRVPIEKINVPVIGGYSGALSGASILPVFSQDPVASKLPNDKRLEIIERVQEADNKVVEAKKGKGCATLSMAYAGARFGKAVLGGLSGVRTVESAYVKSNVVDKLEFFSSKVTFGPRGVEKIHEIGTLTDDEQSRLEQIKKMLDEEIQEGLKYAEGTELANL